MTSLLFFQCVKSGIWSLFTSMTSYVGIFPLQTVVFILEELYSTLMNFLFLIISDFSYQVPLRNVSNWWTNRENYFYLLHHLTCKINASLNFSTTYSASSILFPKSRQQRNLSHCQSPHALNSQGWDFNFKIKTSSPWEK